MQASEIIAAMSSMDRSRSAQNTAPPADYLWDGQVLPSREYRAAIRHPYIREKLQNVSMYEDDENSYYNSMLNTIANDCVGPMPILLSKTPNFELNTAIERQWIQWGLANGIGSSIRELRREAAKLGIGILVPYPKSDGLNQVSLAFRAIPANHLRTPPEAMFDDRIYNGIEYNENWEAIRIYVHNPDSYFGETESLDVDKIILWGTTYLKHVLIAIPECGPAFTVYPSVRRYFDAVVRGEEFSAAIPMALELNDSYRVTEDTPLPEGSFKYEPGLVPTLPPGTKLAGVTGRVSSAEREHFLRTMVAAATACKSMPANLAMRDSSDHNMASAQVDLQPWKNQVAIDRQDFFPAVEKMFRMWYSIATIRDGYLPVAARQYDTLRNGNTLPHQFAFTNLFHHPDPNKVSNARATDLAAGTETLSRIYGSEGLNADVELNKEAALLGITREELNKTILLARTNLALSALSGSTNEDTESPSRKRERSTR